MYVDMDKDINVDIDRHSISMNADTDIEGDLMEPTVTPDL